MFARRGAGRAWSNSHAMPATHCARSAALRRSRPSQSQPWRSALAGLPRCSASSMRCLSAPCLTPTRTGDNEVVACYDVTTGQPVWIHRDAARFFESNGGPGPRGTPALSNGRAYTLGATGILNALDAGNGDVVWSRNVASDTGAKVPYWGFSSSSLVVDDLVIVAAAGQLVAYDLATGDRRWSRPAAEGHSS